METIHALIALCKRFIQKPVGYLLNVFGQWVSSARVYSFFCNLLGSHLCWLYTSEIRINHFFDWKKNQQFLFGFISTKGSAKIGNQTKAGKRDWATALGLGRDYSRLSALFAFSIEFLFSHSYSQACILMGTPNRRHRLHVYGWRWRKTTLLATFWLGDWGIVVLY